MYKRQYKYRQNINIVKIYAYASELRKLEFLHNKSAILSIWMGRNNHLQINILKHILRMHKHDFCGEQSIYTRAILANTKYVCMIFFFGGGHRCPPDPPPPPVATPLLISMECLTWKIQTLVSTALFTNIFFFNQGSLF